MRLSNRDYVFFAATAVAVGALCLLLARGTPERGTLPHEPAGAGAEPVDLRPPSGLPAPRSLSPVIIGDIGAQAAPPRRGAAGDGTVFGVAGRGFRAAAAPAQPVARALAQPRQRLTQALNEEQFLRAHAAEIQAYHAKLGAIGERYYQRYKVVRDVDAAFTAMPRYMEVRDQFIRERNPFKFARDAIALPEVRAEIARRLAQPDAWKVAVGMMTEALKNPPPPELYKAAQQFMASEQMTEYLKDFTTEASKNAAVVAKALPETDVAALSKLAQDVAPNAMTDLQAQQRPQPR